ncbi:hypothetical protein PILCRDRAFT_792606 [Piloderma croceum F 1598]|uniref:Uncharacterized protein n=1 Tax=Piloderma croceum (strain F 1598) TaxID=765440 RepID=A0A0C3BP04_PILCF|nr:hypothetical protein PILCRDRAFT_792606 [Piloderma croceum F 1598]
MGLLRYKQHDAWRRIQGSIAQGREMLAAADLPGQDQRNFEALCWTMESLTENSKLEPVVQDIPECVTKVLKTCMASGGLSAPHTRRRAIPCMNAISALVMLVVDEDWASLDFFDDDLRYNFGILKEVGLDKPFPKSTSVVLEQSLATTSALDTLYVWGSLDSIIEKSLIPCWRQHKGSNQNLVLTCRTRYIPGLLSTCHGEGTLEEEERETHVVQSLWDRRYIGTLALCEGSNCLETLELRPYERKSLAKGRSHANVVLSCSQIAISLLYYMKTTAIPEDELENTLEILRFIAHNLTARFSSRTAQALVVDLAG